MDFLEAFLDFFDKYPWMPFVLVIGGIILHIIIKDQIGKKKAKTGKDKEKIHNILKTVMGENATYVPVYATRVEHRANSRAYYYYGLAMQEERMILVPLSFADQEVGYGKPFQIRKDQLGKIKTSKKMDATFQLAGLYDKENKLIIELVIRAEETRIDKKTDPVNLWQKDEVLEFAKILFRWRDEL